MTGDRLPISTRSISLQQQEQYIIAAHPSKSKSPEQLTLVSATTTTARSQKARVWTSDTHFRAQPSRQRIQRRTLGCVGQPSIAFRQSIACLRTHVMRVPVRIIPRGVDRWILSCRWRWRVRPVHQRIPALSSRSCSRWTRSHLASLSNEGR